MKYILQTPSPPVSDIINASSKVITDNLTAALLGFLFGLYFVITQIRLPDRLREFDEELEDVKNRQRKIIKLLGSVYRDRYKLPEDFSADPKDEEITE